MDLRDPEARLMLHLALRIGQARRSPRCTASSTAGASTQEIVLK